MADAKDQPHIFDARYCFYARSRFEIGYKISKRMDVDVFPRELQPKSHQECSGFYSRVVVEEVAGNQSDMIESSKLDAIDRAMKFRKTGQRMICGSLRINRSSIDGTRIQR